MANPVGEDSWLAYVDEESRHATDLEARVKVIELFKTATSNEPGSLKIWLAYCEYFWSLFTDCQSAEAGWPEEEQQLGRQIFTFDSALSLWSDGYDQIRYRLNDSHEFWNRWISIEMEQLARTRTPVGVRRISHLFRNRLEVPHATWDNTSQMFSSFLSNYNNANYEAEFKEVTASSQGAKAAYERREPFELKLNRAARTGDNDEYKAVLREYLDWEMTQGRKNHKDPAMDVNLCVGLYTRAVTGIFTTDEDIWNNFSVYVSTMHTVSQTSQVQYSLPDLLQVHQRAVSHCPWSGILWARYILSAEEAGLPFQDVEHIKHAATNTNSLDKNGMTAVIEMYAAWCGYLKRTAMHPNASEDATDIADVGLTSALEDIQLWGERLYKDAYRGDPNYRIERILVQYLTEKKGEVDQARAVWNRAADKALLADSYDFWLNYYLWEMMVFSSQPRPRSPTPAGGNKPLRVPTLATGVLSRAINRRTLDWPERIAEVYSQHLNDYEHAETLRKGLDTIHKARRAVQKRREQEQAEAAAAYAAQMQAHQHQQQPTPTTDEAMQVDSPSQSKRKREESPGDDSATHLTTKRSKSGLASENEAQPRDSETNGTVIAATEQSLKRDRENTSILVTNLPPDATQTAIKKYFRDYGHVNTVNLEKETDGKSAAALVEFESPEDMQSALLRDQKYFGTFQITVKPATGLTIYVTNYPPTADEDYIRGLFKTCGEIFSVRFPSLKFNTHRRFCYVSFRDAEAAAKATQLDGKMLEKKYPLVAKYSDPSRKKKRDGAVAEGRELRIRNLDLHATEDDVSAMLQKYGTVQNVKIIRNISGKSRGTAFAVFETKEQAERATTELDKTKMRHNILDVEISAEATYKPTATSRGRSASAAPSAAGESGDVVMGDDGNEAAQDQHGPSKSELAERTMGIMNVPDTMNDTRLRAIVEKHGEIVKLVLRPDHQGATVEFVDVATMGRAMMHLDGLEIAPGRKLRTGTVKDLMKQKAEQRDDKVVPGAKPSGGKTGTVPLMVPPSTIRRPALGAGSRGGKGPRRGLGFAPARKGTEPAKADGGDDAETPKPKSNADFKALFLSGGEKTQNGT